MNCVFCKIIARELPGYIIAEDESTIIFVSLEGHPIVAPRLHVPDIFGLDDDLAAILMKTTRDVARATREGLAADGIYIAQTNGSAAGQSVFHYHVHIYPRWHDRRTLDRRETARVITMERVRERMRGEP